MKACKGLVIVSYEGSEKLVKSVLERSRAGIPVKTKLSLSRTLET